MKIIGSYLRFGRNAILLVGLYWNFHNARTYISNMPYVLRVHGSLNIFVRWFYSAAKAKIMDLDAG